jgi:hypothetical protein
MGPRTTEVISRSAFHSRRRTSGREIRARRTPAHLGIGIDRRRSGGSHSHPAGTSSSRHRSEETTYDLRPRPGTARVCIRWRHRTRGTRASLAPPRTACRVHVRHILGECPRPDRCPARGSRVRALMRCCTAGIAGDRGCIASSVPPASAGFHRRTGRPPRLEQSNLQAARPRRFPLGTHDARVPAAYRESVSRSRRTETGAARFSPRGRWNGSGWTGSMPLGSRVESWEPTCSRSRSGTSGRRPSARWGFGPSRSWPWPARRT